MEDKDKVKKEQEKKLYEGTLNKDYPDGLVVKSEDQNLMEVSDIQLEKINKFTLKPLTKEQVRVFKFLACNNQMDRTFDVFTDDALKSICETAIGKSFMDKHDYGLDEIGRIFDAEIVEEFQVPMANPIKHVKMHVYIPVLSSGSNKDIIEAIEMGLRRFVSVGVRTKKQTCSVCGLDYFGGECSHFKGRTYEDRLCFTYLDVKELLELSSVYLGAQYNAQSTKSFEGGNEMEDLKVKAEQLETDNQNLTKSVEEKNAEIETLKTQVNQLNDIVKELGEGATVDTVKELKAKAVIGDQAKENLIVELKATVLAVQGQERYNEALLEKSIKNFDYNDLKEYHEMFLEEKKKLFPEAVKVSRSTEPTEYEEKQKTSEAKTETQRKYLGK